MKMLVILTACLLGTPEKSPKEEYAWFAHVSPKKDTLYLLANDPLSEITARIWRDGGQAVNPKPSIVLVSKARMQELKNPQKPHRYGKN
jgi:hypothetical protein